MIIIHFCDIVPCGENVYSSLREVIFISTSGLNNEIQIANELHEKKFSDLNSNLQSFIKYIANEEELDLEANTMISSHVIHDNSKGDIKISFLNNDFNISIKKGSSNSVHQETITSFLEFIDEDLEASEDIISSFDWFINDLKSARELKREKPEELLKIKNFLEDNKKIISERFIKKGLGDSNHTDYIYYGDPVVGTWGEVDKTIEVVISKYNTRATLPMGSLTLQAWNRTNENKRYVIQAKWSNIQNDLNEVRNS